MMGHTHTQSHSPSIVPSASLQQINPTTDVTISLKTSVSAHQLSVSDASELTALLKSPIVAFNSEPQKEILDLSASHGDTVIPQNGSEENVSAGNEKVRRCSSTTPNNGPKLQKKGGKHSRANSTDLKQSRQLRCVCVGIFTLHRKT